MKHRNVIQRDGTYGWVKEGEQPEAKPETKTDKRIQEFERHGIITYHGRFQGEIGMNAKNADKLLSMLKRLEKLAATGR